MRIISGKYKGRRFPEPVPGVIRPTTDSCKETLFNLLANIMDFSGIYVLDLCAGTGGLGFEALSRGASYCCFLDSSPQSLRYIATFADFLCINSGDYTAIKGNAAKLDKYKACEMKFDLVFLDPPYRGNILNGIINSVTESHVLKKEGILAAEHAEGLGMLKPVSSELLAKRKLGSTILEIFKVANSPYNQ